MTRVTAVIALLACMAPSTTGDQPQRGLRLDAVRRGMSPDEVKRLLGSPPRVARQLLFRRYLEQWHYDDLSGWVEFNMPRGEEAYVVNVHAEEPNARP